MSHERFSEYCDAAEAFEKLANRLRTAAKAAMAAAPHLKDWWQLQDNNMSHLNDMPSGNELRQIVAEYQHARAKLKRAHDALDAQHKRYAHTPDQLEERYKS